MQSYYLGIDIGTGSTKAVAMDLTGKSITVSQHYYETYCPHPGYSEQEPEEIWEAFKNCISDIIQQVGEEPIAICLGSVMHSFIPVDEVCTPVYPMITWADSRSANYADLIKHSDKGEKVYTATGTPIHSMSPLCKIIWYHNNCPHLSNTTYKFISIKEYIWYKLFKEYQIDYSIASATGLFDIEKLEWHWEALELAGIDDSYLSEPVSTKYIRTLNPVSGIEGLNFSTSIKFVIGASDGCLANLGSLATQPGIAAITIGTSGAVRMATTKPISNYETMNFSYRLDEELFICGGPVNNGGIALQWFLKNMLDKNELSLTDYEIYFEQVKSVEPGCKGLVFLPYITGERAPIWDTKSCGNFFGIRLHHTQADFSRAVLEGICFALKDVLTGIELSGETINQINVSGGFVNSTIWMQVLADITGKPICLVQTEDASSIGAVYLGMVATGIIKSYSDLNQTEKIIIHPNATAHEIYNKNFLIFKTLYQNLKDCMHLVYNNNH